MTFALLFTVVLHMIHSIWIIEQKLGARKRCVGEHFYQASARIEIQGFKDIKLATIEISGYRH